MQIPHGRLKYMAFLSFTNLCKLLQIKVQIYVTVTVYKLWFSQVYRFYPTYCRMLLLPLSYS